MIRCINSPLAGDRKRGVRCRCGWLGGAPIGNRRYGRLQTCATAAYAAPVNLVLRCLAWWSITAGTILVAEAQLEVPEFQLARERMVEQLREDEGFGDARVLAAMRETPRHPFVPKRLRGDGVLRHGAADWPGANDLPAQHGGTDDRSAGPAAGGSGARGGHGYGLSSRGVESDGDGGQHDRDRGIAGAQGPFDVEAARMRKRAGQRPAMVIWAGRSALPSTGS